MIFLYTLFISGFYLFGAIPFLILVGRIKGRDISHEPDLHHALFYGIGPAWGLLGSAMDVLKGALPIILGYTFGLPLAVTVLAALAALCGQMWPIFRKFDGERGNTVSLGIVFTLSAFSAGWPVLLIAVTFAVIGFIIRTSSRWKKSGDNINERLKLGGPPSLSFPLSVIIGYASCPLTSWLFGQPLEIVLCYAGALVLMLIRRVTAGLAADLRGSKRPWGIIVNRLLFDRSEI